MLPVNTLRVVKINTAIGGTTKARNALAAFDMALQSND
jgi:hypothetical protein